MKVGRRNDRSDSNDRASSPRSDRTLERLISATTDRRTRNPHAPWLGSCYDPYGEMENAEAELSDDAKDNPFRFEGFYYDAPVRSYDMHARPYHPASGRFLSEDRFEQAAADLDLLADPLTSNRYAFAGGNPVNNIEFDGHIATTGGYQSRDTQIQGGNAYDRQTGQVVSGPAAGTGPGPSTRGGQTTGDTGWRPTERQRVGPKPMSRETKILPGFIGRGMPPSGASPVTFVTSRKGEDGPGDLLDDLGDVAGDIGDWYAQQQAISDATNPLGPPDRSPEGIALEVGTLGGGVFAKGGRAALRVLSLGRRGGAAATGVSAADRVARSVDDVARSAASPYGSASGGLSRAGQSLAKHQHRGGPFPRASGSPAAISRQAQDIVDEVLTNPASTFTTRQTGRFGEVIDVHIPGGPGVRYSERHGFLHFLEP